MNNQTMGGMIASLRREKGMTQADLAKQMGVTDKAVSKWERDLSCPDVQTLPKLAEVLGISVEELLQPTPKTGNLPSSAGAIVTLVFKAVALAMGVSVTVLSTLNALDAKTGLTLLGIGLSCVGIVLLQKKD